MHLAGPVRLRWGARPPVLKATSMWGYPGWSHNYETRISPVPDYWIFKPLVHYSPAKSRHADARRDRVQNGIQMRSSVKPWLLAWPCGVEEAGHDRQICRLVTNAGPPLCSNVTTSRITVLTSIVP